MPVYVVTYRYEYDDCALPVAVFTSLIAAKRFCGRSASGIMEITALTLDGELQPRDRCYSKEDNHAYLDPL